MRRRVVLLLRCAADCGLGLYTAAGHLGIQVGSPTYGHAREAFYDVQRHLSFFERASTAFLEAAARVEEGSYP